MRRHVPLLLSGLFALLFFGAAVYVGLRDVPAHAQPSQGPSGPTRRLVLQVDGLTCGSCEGKVQQALRGLPGVRSVSVNLADRTVAVDYLEGSSDPKALAEAVTRAGYPARYVSSGSAPGAPVKAGGPGTGCGGSCCSGGS